MKHVHAEANGKIIAIDGEEFVVPRSFIPSAGDDFYYIGTVGDKAGGYVFKSGEQVMNLMFETLIHSGNCYKTEAEVRQALKFWKKINEVTE